MQIFQLLPQREQLRGCGAVEQGWEAEVLISASGDPGAGGSWVWFVGHWPDWRGAS